MEVSEPSAKYLARPAYKQTKVGIIPEDWVVSTLSQLCSMKSGVSITSSEIDQGSEYPCYGGNGFRGYTANYTHEGSYALVGRQGALCGNVVSVHRKFFASEHAIVVAPSKIVDIGWLTFVLGNMKLNQYSESSAQPGLSTSKILSLVVSTPPTKSEQQAIAEALSDADALIESLEQLLTKKRQIKQGTMRVLLTGKHRLPGFNDGWEATTLGAISERIIGGGTPSRNNPTYWNGSIPWMTVKDFADHSAYGTLEYITTEGLKNSASNLIPSGTLITSTRMALGKAAMFDVDVCINQDLKAIHVRKDVDPNFLFFWFQFNEPRIAELGSGSTVMGISLPELRKLQFSKPHRAEQTAIATTLSDIDTELAALETKLTKARQIKQGMMQELLTGRIRLVQPKAEVISFPTQENARSKQDKARNWQINEAVVIAVLARHFGSEQWPLGRKRYTKLSYLLHRHVEVQAEGYLKKAAGPYNPATKYKGPEGIALKNGYVRQHVRDPFSGFVAAENIGEAEDYFLKWYGAEVLTWLKQFRLEKNDELELLATVDMAMEDLRRENKAVALGTVRQVIQSHPEWQAKLDREIFSDANIERAMVRCDGLFGER